jgi:hypothetical protein
MTATADGSTARPVRLTDEDIGYLISVLRDPNRAQPITTQQLIDALRTRGKR